MEGGCPGNTDTVGRVEDEQTPKMPDRQRTETQKNLSDVREAKGRLSRKDRQGPFSG